jgi:hypothetical protein
MSEAGARERAVERLVVELGVALQSRGVYPSGHPSLGRSVERAIAAHRAVLALADAPAATTLLAIEGQLLVDRVPVPEDAAWSRGLLLGFERHGLSGLTLLAGLDGAELAAFLDACHGASGPQPSSHVQIGAVGFAELGPGAERGLPGAGRLPPLTRAEELAEGRESFAAVAGRSAREVDRLRSLVAALARAAGGAQLASPRLATVNPGDREFLHGLATALGTLRLARALGVEGDRLQELGLAALLHDIGRLEAGPLGGDAAHRAHPVVGAARLAATPGVPPVAVVAAFEHHLRFDGAPNYPVLDEARGPSAAAQIVAVADTWDTLRVRGGLAAADAVPVLRRRAGTYLNPALVEIFVALIEGGGGRRSCS